MVVIIKLCPLEIKYVPIGFKGIVCVVEINYMVVDGGQGEGGGQVLRTCLSLAAITGRPLTLFNIRGKRSRPGLRPQHLTAMRAVAQICGAQLSGDRLDSTSITFEPTMWPVGGDYFFDVNEAAKGVSAGAVTLVVQAILFPLLFADQPSRVVLRGGTFVPFSPPYHYWERVGMPALSQFHLSLTSQLIHWGWMDGGGGEIRLTIQPVQQLIAADFLPQPSAKVAGVAAVTNLPADIPQRMANRATNLLTQMGYQTQIIAIRANGTGMGAGIILWLNGGGFSSLGRKGLPADKVADRAVAELRAFADNQPPYAADEHLADQLLLPMALAKGQSSLTTNRLTQHTLTNAQILRSWFDLSIEIEGELGEPAKITVMGVGHTNYHV